MKGSSSSRNGYPTPSATPYGTSQNEGQVAHKRPTAGTPSLDTWAKNWHTPMAGDARAGPNQHTQSLGKDVKNWPTPAATDWKGESQFAKHGRPHRTSDAVANWATPTAHDGRRPGADVRSTQGNNLSRDTANWATPTAGDAKQSGAAGYPTDGKRNAGTTLTDMVSGPRGPLGQPTPKDGDTTSQRAVLNPQFVEALMGLPPGWSFAQIVSDASETQSSPKQQSLRGER